MVVCELAVALIIFPGSTAGTPPGPVTVITPVQVASWVMLTDGV